MKHLRKFPDAKTRDAVLAIVEYGVLSYTEGEGMSLKPTPPDPKSIPFYIDVRSAVTLAATSGLQMSTDMTNWTDTTATTLSSGKTYFRVASDQSTPLKPNWTEGDNSDYDIGGNINSLVKVNFENDDNCYSFYQSSTGFFKNKNKLKSAGNLILPATKLTNECYHYMFQRCTALTAAPALPATTLADYCYSYMFWNCTSLTTAPALPATTLAQSCYLSMFEGCTSLTTTPALSATTLADDCYNSMFNGCTSLTTAPALPATTLVESCYMNMFYGCTALTAAPALPATTLANNCYNSMLRGCTSLTTAPALPATTLATQCYRNMFWGCTSLTTAPVLPATTLANNCYGMMFFGCTNLNKVTTYAKNISASGCLSNWLNGVSPTGDFYNLGGATYESGANGIPTGWTVKNAA